MSTQPTDDEIDALWDGKDLTIPQLVQRRIITRAVLAKWGTPATGGEPLAWMRKWAYNKEQPFKEKNAQGRWAWPVRFKIRPVTEVQCLPDDVPLYTSPQPVREPVKFTKAQQERLYRNRPANVGKSVSLADWRRTVEFIEAAHGITGGQHGTG